ncbi:hypothetical protein CQA53_01420 [Helicobacter didelphidarum]|uniref:Uncharacterized protein n=1 Tax=Helicobacter didelphidarum TaxID=2040648 RepID=A0A3D8IRX0_9HELI|nr:hypothetical protein [Helicobacter didelphidarum]RDU67686.1 hypothetical protein CQA53_01420 [Helicobacter didelphidarum]
MLRIFFVVLIINISLVAARDVRDLLILADVEIPLAQSDIFYSIPTDSVPNEVPLQKENTIREMQEQQMDIMKKEYRGNPANSDIVNYKHNEIQKQINKDVMLRINPDTAPEIEEMSETQPYEFIIKYDFKLVNDVPYGEKYAISTPLNTLGLSNRSISTKVCELNLKEKFFTIKHYPHYTKTEMQASIKKQIRYLLYNFLQEYKTEVLECLMLHQTYLDDRNTTINLESRTKTITKVHSYVLVDFNGGILRLKVFPPKDKNTKKGI